MTSLNLTALTAILVLLAAASVALAPKVRTADGFFRGWTDTGEPPGVLTLTLSQVTTWIFARSLLNAGILGYFFGIAGVLAYTAYYGSFLTGWLITDRLRFRHGAPSVQAFLFQRFGRVGTWCFNLLISLRLLSEVFANLLVIGIVFSAAGEQLSTVAIIAVAGVTLAYSAFGGLRASLRTDALQMVLLAGALLLLLGLVLVHPQFSTTAVVVSSPEITSPGWILLAVALLQVLSYPLHDPVMMDRGFIADRRTTRRSFLHAFWLSSLCILAFGLLGVFAGLNAGGEGEFLKSLESLLGGSAMLVLAVALVLSAASTMDSVYSSTAKLAVVDMGLGRHSPGAGRLAMVLTALGGLVLVLVGTDDLFAAVAVSGTASLFLAPVIVFSILKGCEVARWSLLVAFALAMAGSGLYFLEDSGYIDWIGFLTGLEHSYSKLLVVTVAILAGGMAAFALGQRPAGKAASGGTA
ncbi:sodium:proline symporter [Aquisalimonas sp. 2447]|uniref:sodium:solute symporter family transporter n=1 Tax=Aquisalimonas sp. 2447 TaxID=2740807 RepID=UPI0014325D35|nr:sodium:proline symporter [Aquisalimonas sp. 2447]QIT56097.1 sodium:proline symporter [Aquisalimonas sp. 2447]